MKILQLSTYDTQFGGAIAARRLHEALLAHGEECDVLVSEKRGNFPRTHAAYEGLGKLLFRARRRLDFFPLKFYDVRSYSDFSPNWVPSNISTKVDHYHPDVVHMHWCQGDFVPTPSLPRMGRPIIWTFHDMWAFTGGCHYSGACDRYHTECGTCPVLKSTKVNDLSRKLWKQKRDVYARLRNVLQVVCPSSWMASLARNAPLLEGVPVHAVPNPINTAIFKPGDKFAARRLLGLPEKGPLLLMGSASTNDPRKGFDLLDEALSRYAGQASAPTLGLLTLGGKADLALAISDKLKVVNIDFIPNEERLAVLYNAIDAVVLPSREENLSNMLSEALCCGVPCLAFEIGGNGDLISHQVNGYLAKPADTADMAAGLAWILNNLRDDRRDEIATAAHARVSYESLVPRFLEIYQGAIARARTS